MGGNGGTAPGLPSGNGWPVDPLNSTGFGNCITGSGGPVNLSAWNAPANWVSIFENDSSPNWTYYAYPNEFMDENTTVAPSTFVVDRTYPIDADSLTCDLADICFPLSKITSLLNKEIEGDLLIFPNPVRNELTVKINENHKIKEIILIDIAYRKVDVEVKTKSASFILDVDKLSSGTYIISLVTENNKVLIDKFIKE